MVDSSLIRIVGLGFVSGLRSMAGPALLARHLKRNPPTVWPHPLLRFLGEEPGASLVQSLAGGELIADKLPFVRARTDLLPLAGRAVSGATVGAALSALADRSPLPGAALGSAAAIAGAMAGYYARRALTGENGLPDAVVALVEDAVTVGVGTMALSSQAGTLAPQSG